LFFQKTAMIAVRVLGFFIPRIPQVEDELHRKAALLFGAHWSSHTMEFHENTWVFPWHFLDSNCRRYLVFGTELWYCWLLLPMYLHEISPHNGWLNTQYTYIKNQPIDSVRWVGYHLAGCAAIQVISKKKSP
jgi:hypothetical protein